MTHRPTVLDRAPYYPRPRPPQPTGGHARAIFELLRFILGVGTRERPFRAYRRRFVVDMHFELPAGALAIEYDSAYFHPDPWLDSEKDHLIRERLNVTRVIRVREAPLPPTADCIMVPSKPDPILCALSILLHLLHDWETQILWIDRTRDSEERLYRMRDAISRHGLELHEFTSCHECHDALVDEFYIDPPTSRSSQSGSSQSRV